MGPCPEKLPCALVRGRTGSHHIVYEEDATTVKPPRNSECVFEIFCPFFRRQSDLRACFPAFQKTVHDEWNIFLVGEGLCQQERLVEAAISQTRYTQRNGDNGIDTRWSEVEEESPERPREPLYPLELIEIDRPGKNALINPEAHRL